MTSKASTAQSRVVDEFRDRLASARLALARTAAVSDDDLEALAAHECREEAEAPGMTTVGDLLSRLTGVARETLGEIDAAQARLETGTFGMCEACRGPIALARLRRTPIARRCAECEHSGDPRWRRVVAAAATVVAFLVGTYAAHGQDASVAARGQSVFALNGCYGCHVVGKAGTPIGPELSYVGAKYSQPYLMRWLRDPAEQRPNAHMPALELTDDEIRALAAYLSTLR